MLEYGSQDVLHLPRAFEAIKSELISSNIQGDQNKIKKEDPLAALSDSFFAPSQ
jgi:hypothetical protein